jgi:serine/threonine-protein kinase PpkA
MNRICHNFLLSVILQVLLCPLTSAQSYEELKEDIQRRAGVIENYKMQGGLSEGPDGMLMAAPDAPADCSTAANQENEARRKIFERIAERTGATPEDVARSFAERVPPVQRKTPEVPQPTNTDLPAPEPSSSFVPVTPGSSLPLKILTRPDSSLFAEPSDSAKVVNAAVPAFTTWVAASMRDGWYQVTDAVSRPASGWMRAADVMEWRHHMVVSFTHPGNRSRNIFFMEKASLSDLMKLPRDQRRTRWNQFLDPAAKETTTQVAGFEPEGWLREKNQFYVLPILDQDLMMDSGQELMLLKVAAASKTRGSQEPPETPTKSQPKLDIVFVMDLTRSMGPFVDATLKMLREIAAKVGDDADADAVRIGLWGYRDDPKLCPGIEFNTKNFTPKLQNLPEFLKTLEAVRETKTDSIDYAEDVLAGVHDAIEHTNWRDGSARFILLVGDAPGRVPGESESECKVTPKPEGTTSGMDTRGIRARANDKSVYVSAFYLESPKWKGFTERGLNQFRELSSNPGSSSPDCKLLSGRNPDEYTKAASLWASRLGENLKSLAVDGKLPEESMVDPDKTSPEEAGRVMADNVFRNAFIEWSSSQEDLEAPRDIQGWVSDKDPNDPSRVTMEPGVLLNKTQLSGLRDRVSDLLDALQRQQIEGGDFFRQLQTVVTISGRDPERLGEAASLMESRYFADFLTGLPYKSKVMAMTRDDWRELGADRASQLANEMKSKVKYYTEVYTDASKWNRLNDSADSGAFVAPILIDMLP